MSDKTTILIDKKIIEMLKQSKEYPRQTYNELLKKRASIFIKMKKRNKYDEFLHKIQQVKMRELWGNKEEEFWEYNALFLGCFIGRNSIYRYL